MYIKNPEDKQRIKKMLTIRIVFNIFLFIFILFSFEIVLRIFKIGYGNSPMILDPLLHHRHPKNYTFYSFSQTGEYGNFLVHYDEEGLISNPFATDKKDIINSKIRIALMGDSFMEGTQVKYSEHLMGILEQLAKHNTIIKNYGVSSYSPICYYLQWKYEVYKFKPTHVILLLYNNDIEDDYEMSKIAIYSSTKELRAIPGPPSDGLANLGRNLYIVRFFNKFYKTVGWEAGGFYNKNKLKNLQRGFEVNPDITELSANFILKLEEAISQNGGRLILMAVPSRERLQTGSKRQDNSPLEFSDKCKIWAQSHKILFIDLVKAFREEYSEKNKKLFFEKDIHFNAEGHKVLAKTIAYSFPQIFNVPEDSF